MGRPKDPGTHPTPFVQKALRLVLNTGLKNFVVECSVSTTVFSSQLLALQSVNRVSPLIISKFPPTVLMIAVVSAIVVLLCLGLSRDKKPVRSHDALMFRPCRH